MICLIDRLEQEFAKTTLWLLTSHDHLILMNTPTCEGERLVQVIGTYDEEYFVRYLVPETQSPFPGRAHVEGMALGQDEAMKYIRIAMRLSGGWPDSLELEH